MIDLCIVGGLGRMGRAIAELAESQTDVRITSIWEAPEVVAENPDYAVATGYTRSDVKVMSDEAAAVAACDVVVDFASGSVFDRVVAVCAEAHKPLVTGTTAVPEKEAKLEHLCKHVAVVSAPNMSIGVNVLFGICESLAKVLGPVSDIEIIESHHRTKKDVPSGTALEMGRIISAATGKPLQVARGSEAPLRAEEIVIHSLRVGGVAGKHTIVFAPKGEVLEITHTAQSRACFAAGALKAARYAVQSPPGLYSMADVLGLK
jgi:4-hydroxy-tetrahydrodipicolinate reductase